MKSKAIILMLTMMMLAGGATTTVYASSEPNNVDVVTESAITDFQFQITNENEVEITRYIGTDAEVVIPSTIEGTKVTSIGYSAFEGNKTITSVVLPEELEKISDYAFWGCTNLQGVEIPDTVTYIGRRAFSGSIFTELHIPANVSTIGSLAFGSLSKLETFTVDENNAYFTIEDGVLYTKDKTILKICPSAKTTLTIPAGVIEIEESAFNDCIWLTEMILPESLEVIGQGAFADVTRLENITIPANVKTIEGTPFTNCHRLTDINVSEENTAFVSEDGILYSKDFKTLIRCPEAKETVTISDKTTEIAIEAFFLSDVKHPLVIGKNVTTIQPYAFSAAKCTDIVLRNPDCVLGDTDSDVTNMFNAKVVTVYGYEGSTAQAYAEKYEIPFAIIETFKDVPKDKWYHAPIQFAYEHNLMGGKGTSEFGEIIFDPANTITRAEFVQILYSKENKPDVEYKNIFADVKEKDWFAKAVIWANENGIVKGGDGIFNVNGKITRQEMAAILYKYAVYKDYDVAETADLTDFVDDETVANWAVSGMQWAVKYGVISGKTAEGGKALDPTGTAIRAEAATMMKAFMAAYEGITE